MTTVEIKDLINHTRFNTKDGNIFLTLLYFPLGVVFFLFRGTFALALVILAQVLPNSPPVNSFLNNLACLCFGITVSVENQKRKENVEVFVSNSLSLFDHIAVSKAIGTILPLNKTPIKNVPALGMYDLGSLSNPDNFKKNLEKYTKDKKTPVFVCPEEIPTNGTALLKFNAQYFKFFQKVQPLCITIKRPVFDTAISTLGSTYMNDILFFMFSPFTNYKIKFLPSLERKSLSEDEFADVVRQNIATELKVEATPFSSADVNEWLKRQIAEKQRRNQQRVHFQYASGRPANMELNRMASQVKEVFPHIPVSAIYNDLVITRSIDTTITNILEGRVRYVPEAMPTSTVVSIAEQSSSSPMKIGANTTGVLSPSQLNLAASSFGKTASERARSFQERKEQLIAAARRRYIKKHLLDIPI
ncbi:hypothetical protein ABEB36_012073 [Hypothenemus hampei]|uniref:Lipid droplet-regulating VLDL assembly factor AUP1 n=1 Tax=Hypothenemus hampei TaxID=57062 RepID=A0ABD1EA27_HYPHA